MIVRARLPRGGFTVLEVLVVIAIIALLMTISVSAVFRLQEGQRETNTNTHLRKIQMVLEQQRKAAVSQIGQESNSIPEPVWKLTVNADNTRNQARAKALHTKLRLRREFPQTYAEVNPVFNGPTVLTPSDIVTMNGTYGGKKTYASAIGTSSGNFDLESGALLYLILSTSRGGASTNPDDIAPTKTFDYGGKSMKVFVDEWGQVIGFRRWARDAEMDMSSANGPHIGEELNKPPFVNNSNSVNKDPDDPDGKLKAAPAWTWANEVKNYFTSALPEVSDPFDWQNLNRQNRGGAFAVSIGKDGSAMTQDDLFSFRLARDNRGN